MHITPPTAAIAIPRPATPTVSHTNNIDSVVAGWFVASAAIVGSVLARVKDN